MFNDIFYDPQKEGYSTIGYPRIKSKKEAENYVNWLNSDSFISNETKLEKISFFITPSPSLYNYLNSNDKSLSVDERNEIFKVFFKAQSILPINCNKCGTQIIYNKAHKVSSKETISSTSRTISKSLVGGSRVDQVHTAYSLVTKFYCDNCYKKVIREKRNDKILVIIFFSILALFFGFVFLHEILK